MNMVLKMIKICHTLPVVLVFLGIALSLTSAVILPSQEKAGIEEGQEFSGVEDSLSFLRYGNLDKRIRWVGDKQRVMSWEEIRSWGYSAGISVSAPSSVSPNPFGLFFNAPGLGFSLYTSNPEIKTGWILTLDLAVFRERLPYKTNDEKISSSYSYLERQTSMEIWINNVFYKKMEMGYGAREESPSRMQIPYIQSSDGRVDVDIRLRNFPGNFAILYSARVHRELNPPLPF